MVLNLRKINSQELMSKPERQYKFVLIYCKTGYVKIEIDNQVYEMSDRQFLTISPKQFYQFIKIINCNGYILEFTYDFFCKDDKSVELIYHNGLYCHFGLNELIRIPTDGSFDKVTTYFASIENELENRQFEFEASLHSIIKLLIIEVSRFKITQQESPLYKPDALFLLQASDQLKCADFTNRAAALPGSSRGNCWPSSGKSL